MGPQIFHSPSGFCPSTEVEKIEVPGLVQNGSLINEAKEEGKMYLDLVSYDKINKSIVEEKLTSASPETKDAVQAARDGSAPKALLNMCIFPLSMLIAYIGIYMYFKSRGGYKPIELDSEGGSSSDD